MRDANEEPTGELKEGAQALIFKHIPKATEETTYRTLLQHMDEAERRV